METILLKQSIEYNKVIISREKRPRKVINQNFLTTIIVVDKCTNKKQIESRYYTVITYNNKGKVG